MNFLTPLAFSLAALLPVIVALYFLKLRREERSVSSTYLWRTLVRDTAANAPWQRLRPNLLLLLQLLFLAALILTLARPFTWSKAVAGSHLILVMDTSASMGATDVKPNRLAVEVAQARQLIESLPAFARVTLIEAGDQVRVPVSSASERGAALSALAALRPGPAGSDLGAALTLASAIAAREPDSEVVILSDGHVTLPDVSRFTLPGRVRYVPVGKENDNQAIGVFSVQAESGGRSLTAFAQVANYSAQPAQRRLVLYADGQLVTARDVALAPSKSQPLTLPGLPPDAREFEARLEGQDLLAADDRAWAVAPSIGKVAVRIVGPGNRFLETALALLPNVEVNQSDSYSVTLSISGQSTGQSVNQSIGQPINQRLAPSLTIFDSLVPTETLPAGSLLFIAPPRSTELFSVTGRIDAPVPGLVAADDPLLRYVDLRDVAVQDAARVPLPAWGRAAIVDTRTGSPLLIVGEPGGQRVAVLTFDLRRSDLALRVAFPLLMANLLDSLVPGGALGIPANVEPGRPVAIPAPPQAGAITVHAPDGQVHKVTPSEGRALFEQTTTPGVYEVAWQDDAGRPNVLGRFVVNLFNANESDITPRETLPIASAGAAGEQALPRARDEWWRPIAWAALVLLVAEWLLSHRGQLMQLLRRGA